mmetsp:Transcript_10819/g.15258  ORF Transcript_10819/g.15258 Transcript_10819/m.15258 type:complete len:113 (+) Transcript_10819:425-763(+)
MAESKKKTLGSDRGKIKFSKKQLRSKIAALETQLDDMDKQGDTKQVPSIDQLSAVIAATHSLIESNNKTPQISNKGKSNDNNNSDPNKRKTQDDPYKVAALSLQQIMKRHKS